MMADINIGPEAGGVPGGASSAVRIPVLPTVSTPLRDAPPISRWRGAGIPETVPVQTQDIFEGIENAGEKLGQIFAAQGHNQRALQADTVTKNYETADKLAQLNATTNGSYIGSDDNSYTKLYQQQSEKDRQAALNDPNNKGVLADPIFGPQIQQRLLEIQNHGTLAMVTRQGTAAQADQAVQLKSKTHLNAITAGADYRVAPDGSIGDGPEALQNRQDTTNLIQNMKGLLPEEKVAAQATFTNDVAMQRGMAIAQKQPTLASAFIKNPGPGVVLTPQQQNQIITGATESIRRPMAQIDANNDAVRAQLINKYNAQAAAGKLDSASLYNDAAHHLIHPEDFEHFTGMPYAPPSDPYSVKQTNASIAAATSEHELDELRVGIASNPNLRGKELAGLGAQLEAQRNVLKTQRGQAVANGHDAIEKAFNGYTGMDYKLYDKLAPLSNKQKVSDLRAQAKADYTARISGVDDPVEIKKAVDDAIKNNQPDLSIVRPDKAAPLPPGTRGKLPGESDAAYGAYLRSKGIHS